jgi:CHAT domain/Ternary complex associated domain 7
MRVPLDSPVVPTDTASASAEAMVLLAALREQRIELLDAVPLEPVPGAVTAAGPVGRRTRGPILPVPPRQAVTLSLPIHADEHAVVLLEQDGVYRWKLPDDVDRPSEGMRRRGAIAESPTGIATFRIDVYASPADAMAVRRQTRGVISHFVFGGIRAYVLKFAAHAIVGEVMSHLERHIRTGLVAVGSLDPTDWHPVEPADVKLPRNRPARVLLLVHGTFSSTVGGFGGLGAHPWGRQFLQTALDRYDAVLGFDHRTLSVDPFVNASELMELLQALPGGRAPSLDVVTHSRGGLVTRSLVELLLPFERGWQPQIEHVVFVASTNHGTRLAEPDNWNALIDLYTNLAMAATRALGLVPQAALFASIVGGVVQGVGSLVEYMVGAMITDKDVPGLAAMEPDGDFVTKINETQPGQPDPQHSSYFAVTSDFEVSAPGDGPKELPPHFLMMLADGFIDRLFRKAPSDLVVDTASMTAIDPAVGGFVDDTFDFGTNPFVYHCNYFLRPEVTTALAHWLGLPEPGFETGGRPPTPRNVAYPRLSVRTNQNFIEVAADAVGTDVLEALREHNPDYVLVRRPQVEGGYVYAFQQDEVKVVTTGPMRRVRLSDSLDLRETTATPRVAPSYTEPIPAVATGGAPPTTLRRVVFVGDRAVGVLPETRALLPIDEVSRAVWRGARPKPRRAAASAAHSRRVRGGGRLGTRRSLRYAAIPGGRGGPAVSPPAPQRVARARARAAPPTTPRVYAEMPPEIEVGKTDSVHVSVTSQTLTWTTGAVSKQGELGDAFDPSKPLLVQVMARRNVEVVNDDRATVEVPGENDPPVDLYFDVRGVSEGAGEVWVTVRQGPPPLLTLVLTPQVVAAGAGGHRTSPARPVRAEQNLPATVPPSWSLPTLTINERLSAEGVVYDYDLDLPNVGRYHNSSTNLGDRDAYVNGIYSYLENAWLETKGDVASFAQNVRSYGGTLFDELFPSDIQRLLWKHRHRLTNIRILSTEPFIPWELIHLKSPETGRLPRETFYLAQMGLVRWLYNEEAAPLDLRVREGKAWTVTPNYPDQRYVLTEPAKEAAFLQKAFGAKPVDPQTNRVMALLKKRGAVDLFHFAGHGAAAGGSVQNARILLQGRMNPNPAPDEDPYIPDELPAMLINQQGNLAKPDAPVRPLVVLNACQVGRSGMQLSSIGGFAQAFIHAGAGAFVSSLWAVGDEPAASFTTEFYWRLKAGATIAKAAVAAREKARAAGDATWLAYVVYAHPDAKLV